MPKNFSSRPVKKDLPKAYYGDEITTYIEECRQSVARARRQDVITGNRPGRYLRPTGTNGKKAQSTTTWQPTRTGSEQEEALRKLESDLTRRELDLIEREIKCAGLQRELDQLRPLSGLYRVVKAMATERKLEALLDVITRETRQILKCDRLNVFVLEPQSQELWTQGVDRQPVRLPLASRSIVSITARSGEVVNIPDAYTDPRFDSSADALLGYHTATILCVPMHNHEGAVIGVFEATNKSGGPFTADDEEWLTALTAVAAGLIEQAQAYAEIEHFVDKTLETLAQTIDKRDPLTAGHSIRVTRYSLLIGNSLGLPRQDMDVLRYAAMMHDYGKIGVPEAILWKNGRLTPQEYGLVQTHARITYELLSNLPFTRRLADVPVVASCHHEKLDGSGYYRGLKGGEIPFLARIITVADVFDALTSVRHYRNRMVITKVSEIMESGREHHFDSDVIAAFSRVPADQIITVMESERGQDVSAEFGPFNLVPWHRLIELCDGAVAEPFEEGLRELFDHIYFAGLPTIQDLD